MAGAAKGGLHRIDRLAQEAAANRGTVRRPGRLALAGDRRIGLAEAQMIPGGAGGQRLQSAGMRNILAVGAGGIETGEIAHRPIAGQSGQKDRIGMLGQERRDADGTAEDVFPQAIDALAIGLDRENGPQVGEQTGETTPMGRLKAQDLITELSTETGSNHGSLQTQ